MLDGFQDKLKAGGFAAASQLKTKIFETVLKRDCPEIAHEAFALMFSLNLRKDISQFSSHPGFGHFIEAIAQQPDLKTLEILQIVSYYDSKHKNQELLDFLRNVLDPGKKRIPVDDRRKLLQHLCATIDRTHRLDQVSKEERQRLRQELEVYQDHLEVSKLQTELVKNLADVEEKLKKEKEPSKEQLEEI